MAEAAVMLMLALSYRLDRSRDALHAVERPAHFAHMLKGSTIGLIGYGRIARAIVRRLAAWDVKLLSHTRSPSAEEGVAFVGLDELLAQSDVVSVHVPLTPETRNLLNAERLGRMKPSAILVNLARGGIVDEAALARLMRDGRIAGAALDVFANEPLPKDDPLNGLSNTILTPHIVGHTVESTQSLVDCTADNVACMLAGQPPRHLINPDVLQTWRDRWRNRV
jgi:phosphoglycerate dehydrogenase-like enzyme